LKHFLFTGSSAPVSSSGPLVERFCTPEKMIDVRAKIAPTNPAFLVRGVGQEERLTEQVLHH
jgi:hypothetical protein